MQEEGIIMGRGIIEVDMPEKCIHCKLAVQESSSSKPWCKITGNECTAPYNKRNEDCPIKEAD